MLSKSKTRSIVTANEVHSIYAAHSSEEMFYFDGTNTDAIVQWGNGSIRLENGNLIIPVMNTGGERVLEAKSYIIHSRGVTNSGNPFYFFNSLPARIAVHRYTQKALRNKGEVLIGREQFIVDAIHAWQ